MTPKCVHSDNGTCGFMYYNNRWEVYMETHENRPIEIRCEGLDTECAGYLAEEKK